MAEYVSKASILGIVTGYPDGSFGVGKTATRAEAAVMVNRAMMAETGEKVLPAEEALKAAIEGYADRWAYVQSIFAREKVNDYLKDYALPSVIKWYRDTMQPDEPIPGVYGRLEPGTLQIKILNLSRTLAKVEAHYEVGVRIRSASDGAEAEVMAIKVDEILLMKLSGGKWKVGVVYDQKTTKIR